MAIRSKNIQTLAVVMVCVSLAGGAFAHYWWRMDVYRLAEVAPGVLYRDGLRNTRELANALDKVRPKTAINLVTDAEIADPAKGDFQGGKRLLDERGIREFRIPMKPSTEPTDEQIAHMLAIIDDPANRPVYMHDAQGIVRLGMMVAAWQRHGLGYTAEQAQAAVTTFGKNPERALLVHKFIDSYWARPPIEPRLSAATVVSAPPPCCPEPSRASALAGLLPAGGAGETAAAAGGEAEGDDTIERRVDPGEAVAAPAVSAAAADKDRR
jgi:hypothetical protein